jgi:short-subunit dehydrogenase
MNVSSQAAFQPVAFMGAYAASKSYILHFSEALWAEARSRGVTVIALCPGVTRHRFLRHSRGRRLAGKNTPPRHRSES